MADASYDAVIVGGGTKSMVTAIYLAKYAGMSVGVFEERRELCHGLTSEQSCVPGFIADYHASLISSYNFEPLPEDFPDFEEKGGKIIQGPGNIGAIIQPIGVIGSSIQQTLIDASPGFHSAVDAAASLLTEGLVNLGSTEKYLIVQNVASWIVACTTLFIGRYMKTRHRRKR